jgi:hypothetical protein
MLTTRAFWPGHLRAVGIAMVAYAAIKEFWYDARFETPHQTFTDNLLDFTFYCVGVGIGALVAAL